MRDRYDRNNPILCVELIGLLTGVRDEKKYLEEQILSLYRTANCTGIEEPSLSPEDAILGLTLKYKRPDPAMQAEKPVQISDEVPVSDNGLDLLNRYSNLMHFCELVRAVPSIQGSILSNMYLDGMSPDEIMQRYKVTRSGFQHRRRKGLALLWEQLRETKHEEFV